MLTHQLRQSFDTKTIRRPTLRITNVSRFEMNCERTKRERSFDCTRAYNDASRKLFRGMGIIVVDIREVDPLGWTRSTALLGQVRRVVIEHRRKVENDKRKPGEGYLQPQRVSKSGRGREVGGATTTRTRLRCSGRRTSAIAGLASSSTGSGRSLIG